MSGYLPPAFLEDTLKSVSANVTHIYPNGTIEIIHRKSYYSGLVPNLGFNIAMIVIWSIILGAETLSLYFKQYWFSITFICAALLEIVGYAGRVWSHFNLYARSAYLMQMICLTIAPVFTMAGMYYQLAKLIEIYSHKFSILPSPVLYSQIFIFCDIVSLVVQAAGGGISGGAVKRDKSVKPGEHVFIAGLSIQVATMSIFLFLWCHFAYLVFYKSRMDHLGLKGFKTHFKISQICSVSQEDIDYMYREKFAPLRNDTTSKARHLSFKWFAWAFTVSVCCIFVRCAYRLAELVDGFKGFIITHEVYFIILDAVMISFATVIMLVIFPGIAFNGREVNIPITRGRTDPELDQSEDPEGQSSSSAMSEKSGGPEDKTTELEEKKSIFKKIFNNPFKK
ncbi:hypothetical protein TPHA_0C00190 [Tetrapisispora phaffii CBS 4417]|uniref:Sphingoid long-chain base transporter RSB1 n=1 Tax=Tetrapisispora phaffii (strain ATCC 24235 / CBS 4417 / NBRC 1672 / NRRL Y-8282 / UCD 70-5) TaxID=1071381 RepID=G8BR00_TETPH|nr:hypothetical protein TPHA_0C00190 [Tetrapisispora phaffii CBS 4417]CCE62176.1 hypothetical protein TPHA_0C00190 [Tetrapisispora phaffii CBS 4417]